ncbi:aromatase/cyclase [Streptomyces sp. NPDC053474]|uniref:aromatase/cyclase n=1 Tax=Streptomyces sp. NPDC053474 TaxID=3365704 RepID=UPI0037D1B141
MTAELTHETVVAAPPRLLFDLVADVVEAPRYFPTHLYAEVVAAESAERDLVARWVIDQGAVRGWRLWRTRDTEALTIAFQHETPKPPLSHMRGEWRFEGQADGGTRVRVRHAYALAPDAPPGAGDTVARQLDGNVPGQLRAIAGLAGSIDALRRNTVTTARSVRVAAPRAALVAAAARAMGDGTAWAHLELPDGRLVFKRYAGLPPHLHTVSGELRCTEEASGTTVRLTGTATLAGPSVDEEATVAARKELEADLHERLTLLARLGPRAAAD